MDEVQKHSGSTSKTRDSTEPLLETKSKGYSTQMVEVIYSYSFNISKHH